MCAINTVVHILADDFTVGGYLDNIEFIDVPELSGFCYGSTRHTRQFVVHAEIVLQSNGCVGLCGGLYFYMLFSLDSLVQSVAPTTAFHNTTGLLVYNLDFTILDDILVVEIEHGVCLQ